MLLLCINPLVSNQFLFEKRLKQVNKNSVKYDLRKKKFPFAILEPVFLNLLTKIKYGVKKELIFTCFAALIELFPTKTGKSIFPLALIAIQREKPVSHEMSAWKLML